uniref:Disulfide isomerase-like protein n=1 Tax=Rhizophora mucronata TaxID=61149 RepID=A0A2P2L7N8_RHIMU
MLCSNKIRTVYGTRTNCQRVDHDDLQNMLEDMDSPDQANAIRIFFLRVNSSAFAGLTDFPRMRSSRWTSFLA